MSDRTSNERFLVDRGVGGWWQVRTTDKLTLVFSFREMLEARELASVLNRLWPTDEPRALPDGAINLLLRCQAAMQNFFSNEFDGGAQFSVLTSDIPAFIAGAAEPPTGDAQAHENLGDVLMYLHLMKEESRVEDTPTHDVLVGLTAWLEDWRQRFAVTKEESR